jgi:serine/threonine-protein kinase
MRELVARVREDQRDQWQAGQRVLIETYLDRYPVLRADREVSLDLIYSEILLREELGDEPRAEEYAERFPPYAAALQKQFEFHELLRAGSRSGSYPPLAASTLAGSKVDSCGPEGLPCPDGKPPVGDDRGQPSAKASGWPQVPGYEILGELGSGGQGVVYQARQVSLGRIVALKVLRGDPGQTGPERLAGLGREAKTLAQLKHPHIVQVYEFGEYAGGPYIAMEYVEGTSLQHRLAGGPLPVRDAAELVETLALAVHAVHRQGIVHRDLKSANVLLTKDNVPKVADFGLAKRLDGEASQTGSGAIVGTAGYMAPEQAAGRTNEVGPAADVYALGVILYEALTGRPPFAGPTWWDTLNQVRHHEPPPLRGQGTPRDLETICLRCLQKDPKKRYASAAELAGRLRLFLDGKPIPDRFYRWPTRMWRVIPAPRRVWVGAILLGILAALVWRPVPPMIPPRPDQGPGDPRKQVEARLQQGHAYVFAGHEEPPGPFRWILGDVGPPRANSGARCVSVETLKTGLLELVADPKLNRYRFAAEIRHDGSARNSLVGIYFGYRERSTAPGVRQGAFFTLSFADRGGLATGTLDADGRAVSRVRLHSCLFEKKGPTPIVNLGPVGRGKEFPPALPGTERGPWRRLLAEVSPERVKVFWGKGSGLLEVVEEVSTEGLQSSLKEMKRFRPWAKEVPADFCQRAGLGIYILQGEASFRNIVVKPLASGE